MANIPEDKLKEVLLGEGLITPEQFDVIKEDAERLSQNIADILISRNIITTSYYYNLLSEYLKIDLANLASRTIDMKVFNLINEDIARQKRLILFGREADGAISVAMADPGDLTNIEFLEKYLKNRIKPYLASENDLNKGFSFYSRAAVQDYKKLIEANVRASLQSKIKGEKGATEVPIIDIINNFLSYAMALRASDIHMEIFEDGIIVRYRIDGILHEVFRMPKEIYPAIVARIKLLGALKIDEHYKPQDGRFRYKIGGDVVDMRVSIMPTFYGEKIVMRLLPGTTRPLSFTELGIRESMADILAESIKRSFGMVLICGPTGSGKSTTLYSILGLLNRPEVNIVTIEDPIEYDIRFVNQTQVNTVAGIDFASGLRAILRQDPNIIMVGEIRDIETADISIQAALTGHMVLSSLHTNDAPTAIPRLFDMRIPPFLVSAVLNVVIAQRLVRRVCKDCIYSYETPTHIIGAIRKQADDLGLSKTIKIPKLIYGGKGCSVCGGTGYKGRVGIFEILNISEEVRKLIISSAFSLDNLKKLAKSEGMITMFEDGMAKVEVGDTSVEELLRVIRE